MALSYNRMWKLLVDKKMSKADLKHTIKKFEHLQGSIMYGREATVLG